MCNKIVIQLDHCDERIRMIRKRRACGPNEEQKVSDSVRHRTANSALLMYINWILSSGFRTMFWEQNYGKQALCERNVEESPMQRPNSISGEIRWDQMHQPDSPSRFAWQIVAILSTWIGWTGREKLWLQGERSSSIIELVFTCKYPLGYY